MAPISPTVATWALGVRLKQRRQERGMGSAEAAKALGIAPAYLSDLEHGKKTISEGRLEFLIKQYEYGRIDADELRQLREQATYHRWWGRYSPFFKSEALRAIGYEHGAERLEYFSQGIVPGLLQTEAYARAIIRAGSPNLRLAEVDLRTECRLKRQDRVTGDDPVILHVVLSESALLQQVGGSEVLKDQLRHLAELINHHPETLEVSVVPFEASGHDAMGGSSFHLMHFPEVQLPPLAWQESVTSVNLFMDPLVINEYNIAYVSAFRMALSREDSLRLIQKGAG